TVALADVETAPDYEPWRDAARRAGFASSAATPLRIGGQVVGALSLHAAEPYFFTPEIVTLLEELAADLCAALEAESARREHARRSLETSLDRARLEANRRATEEALRQSEERFRQLFETSRDGIAATDLEGRFTSANPAFLELLGLASFEALTERTLPELTVPELRAFDALMLREVREHAYSPEHEKEYVRRDGTHIPVSVRMWLRRDSSGEAVGTWVVARDLRDRKETEALIHRLSSAVEQSPVSVIITDLDGLIEYVNPRFTMVTGYTFDEVRGRHTRMLKSGETSGVDYRELWKRISSGGTWQGEFHNRRKSGELFWESAQISPIFDAAGRITGYLALKEDITGRKLLEDQLRQAQKMEAVGRLAGGVAHDFNNLLTVIRGSTAMLLEDLPTSHPMRELVEDIGRAGERATALTRQLLAFSRRQVLQVKVLELPTVVAELARMLQRLIGEDIELVTVSHPPVVRVKADPGQLEQVIINLVVNARDAMPKGGRLRIETSTLELDAAQGRAHAITPGRYAVLSVQDTGVGMSEAVRAHLFEPFFTTKEKGKGTGLGLATVHGIVEQSGGHIEVDSEVGAGTTFRIYFPETEDSRHDTRTLDLMPPARSTGTVLLVEDDDTIRNIVRSVLRRRGYDVVTAHDAKHALEQADRIDAPIALLLTDVILPGGSGATIPPRLRQRHPETKVLYMSGYTDDALAGAGIDEHEAAFIQKPFTPTTLLAKIAEVLAG
ncbi:PAS domain S-box protein, partial [Myxococcota bacterium]|nr:PAS domain S-box protein [Myxococcota bacterium]